MGGVEDDSGGAAWCTTCHFCGEKKESGVLESTTTRHRPNHIKLAFKMLSFQHLLMVFFVHLPPCSLALRTAIPFLSTWAKLGRVGVTTR